MITSLIQRHAHVRAHMDATVVKVQRSHALGCCAERTRPPTTFAACQETHLERGVHGLHNDSVVEHARGVLVQRHDMEPERRERAVLLRREVPAAQGAERSL